ncbi:O-antigen ligase family protein [Bacillus sp. H-16]|uniref:O-antigen ligase family protein n=1 Tax=Alteribacter salitolerans TaxID=2912333 RepID=UPI001965B43E|nr:O-antigen ligase family protein [Alteribacter salitolerans]MBM7095681.1 O-antigen ligase family protein [Alteribacter salitolerans]
MFQFGILQPLAIISGSQAIIAVSTIAIFTILLIIYKFKFKKYVISFLTLLTLFFLTNYFLFGNREVTLVIFMEFLMKSFSLFIIGSFPFLTPYLKKSFYFFAILNFIALTIIVILGFVESISYMRFGYAMLPTLLVSIYALRDISIIKYKLLWILICFSSFIIIFIYGSRGPLVGLLIFIFIILFLDVKANFFKKMFIFLILILGYIYTFIYDGFLKILDFIYFELNLQTYSIIKLKVMVERGLAESSSGRDYLYESFFEQIKSNPIFGSGIGITQEVWGVTPHNLFLQIMLEFGFVGLVIFIGLGGLAFYFLARIRRVNNDLFLLISIIFSVSVGRLLVSSDIWLRQELWLFISILINAFLMSNLKIFSNR